MRLTTPNSADIVTGSSASMIIRTPSGAEIKKEELVRVILQSLKDLGYE
jgi:hypothetical protein